MNYLAEIKEKANTISEVCQTVFYFEDEKLEKTFVKNAVYFLRKHEKSIAANNFDEFEVLETLYRMSKEGISFIDGDAYPIQYGKGADAKLAIIMDFRREKKYYEEKTKSVISVQGLKKGAYQGRYLLSQGEQKIIDVADDFQPDVLKVEKKQSQRGFSYEVATKENRNFAYIATARFANGEIWNYCETTENILIRAKSGAGAGTTRFYEDANAQDRMFEKFVARQLMRNIPATAGKVFDFSFGAEDADIEDVEAVQIDSVQISEADKKASLIEMPKVEEKTEAEKEPIKVEMPQPKEAKKAAETKKVLLKKDAKSWESMHRGISAGKLKSAEDVQEHFEVPDDLIAEIEFLFS